MATHGHCQLLYGLKGVAAHASQSPNPPDHGANAGLLAARDFLEEVKQEFPWVTYSVSRLPSSSTLRWFNLSSRCAGDSHFRTAKQDLWTLGGVVAVQG